MPSVISRTFRREIAGQSGGPSTRLAQDVGSADIRKLSGRTGEWRMPVGRWRVMLELDNRAGLIVVTRILARRDAYRS